MNGYHPSSTVNFGSQYIQTADDSSLSFLSNPMGLSFFGSTSSQASNIKSNTGLMQFSNQRDYSQTSRFSQTPNVRQNDLDRIWGIGEDNTIIDDDQVKENSYFENANEIGQLSSDAPTSIEETAESAAEIGKDVETVEGIAEGAEIATSATPWGLLALLNTQIGQTLNSAISTAQQNQSSQDYQSNMNQHGVNVALNAGLIQQQQNQTIRSGESGGAIGSLFGPIGTLIGHAVAGTVQANPGIFNTAASSQGWINPTNSVAVGSASAAAVADDSTMQDNVD